MKRYSLSIITTCIVIFSSCNQLILKLAGANNNQSFSKIEDYYEHVQSSYSIDLTNLYYVECKTHYNFLQKVVGEKTDIYYGTFIDELNKFKTSEFLNENKSCSGRILNEIENPTQELIIDSIFYQVDIINANTSEKFLPSKGKKNIVLIFSTNLGRFHQKDIIEIQHRFSDTTKYQLAIISMDRICDLKTK